MKIHPVGAELFYADGRTEMTKPRVAFRNFTKAPIKESIRTDSSRGITQVLPQNLS
jgi:hypothetical protein